MLQMLLVVAGAIVVKDTRDDNMDDVREDSHPLGKIAFVAKVSATTPLLQRRR